MVSFVSLAALALVPAVIAQSLMVNTPTGVVECEPVQITWTGGTPPYFLSFVPAGQSSAPAIKQFPTQNGNEFTWNADLGAGTTFTIALKDSAGSPAFSDIVTVESGPNSSCVNSSVTETGASTGTAAPSSGAGGSAPPASTTGAPSGSSSASAQSSGSSGSSTTSSGAASTTSPKPNSALISRGNTLLVAGVMGLVGATLF
ncbi:hypothetical protein K439DRAFT_1642966 [Ramaria rubella]|nr:hypothetical protein K439DRAFT_1642966 [Ramaria rubella]